MSVKWYWGSQPLACRRSRTNAPVSSEPMRNMPAGVLLLAIGVEAERLDEGVSESYVRKPLPVVDRDEQSQMIELRTVGAVCACDTGGEERHLEVESAQERGEGAIELVAEAAPALVDDLADKGRFVDDNRAMADVEVLERNGQHMASMQLTEGVDRRFARAATADAMEVAVEVHWERS